MNVDVDKELFKMGIFYVPKLMPEYGVIVEDRFLFFTNRNSNILVKYDIHKGNIVNIYYLPIGDVDASFLFSGIYNYGDKLFLIPRRANNIVIFDIKNECFRVIEENILSSYDKVAKLGEAMMDDNFLWILSLQKKHILKLDMKQETIKEISINIKCCTDKLVMPFLKNGCIYVTSGDERAGIKIDIDKEEALLWENGANLGNVYICDDFVYSACIKEGLVSIQKRHLYKTVASAIYSSNSCEVGEHVDGWLYEKIDDRIIIVPMYSEYILIYDIKTGIIKKIDLFAVGDDYIYGQKKRPHIATSICRYNEGLFILMSGRYEICYINNDIQIDKIWSFDIDEYVIAKNECKRHYVYERKGQELSCLKKISTLFERVQNEELEYGTNIHKYIMGC
ncbi:MAG: hypothetical protein IJD58_08625 [Lachnospiraceae bacterium]|nr:hypothetical protein [Lachnospiraceae bacterium]